MNNVTLEGLFIRLNHAIDSIGANRVVLDTIESLFGGLANEGILRAELRRLFRFLKEKGVTAIITGERGEKMGDDATDPLEFIEWGLSSIPLKGQDVSGDSYLIKPFPNGILIAVVDGLGHGNEAAAASKIAVSTLDAYAHEPIIPLVRRCHEALKGTRRVVMSFAKLNSPDKMMAWLGVGNIEVLLLKADGKPKISRERLLLRGGTLGYQLPPLRESVIPFMPGDTLIFVTDGIRGSFEEGINPGDMPKQIADSIMAQFNREQMMHWCW